MVVSATEWGPSHPQKSSQPYLHLSLFHYQSRHKYLLCTWVRTMVGEVHILAPDLKASTIWLMREPINLGCFRELGNLASLLQKPLIELRWVHGLWGELKGLKGSQKHVDRWASQERGAFMTSWARRYMSLPCGWIKLTDNARKSPCWT